MDKTGYVYILSSKGRRLYAGVTSELRLRVTQHKAKVHPGSFSARYNIDRLVYYECFSTMLEAIARETVIKNMPRIRKIRLITAANPTWKDLSAEWGKPARPFREENMREAEGF